MNLGATELVVLLVILLLLFGPSRLPGLGKSVGDAIRGFKKGLDGSEEAKHENREQLQSSQPPAGQNVQLTKDKDKTEV